MTPPLTQLTETNGTTRRSPLYRWHRDAGAHFIEHADSNTVESYTTLELESTAATGLAISDLSTLSRVGYKGTGTLPWMTQAGYRLPAAPNQAVSQKDGSLVARLSEHEILWLESLHPGNAVAPGVAGPGQSSDATSGVYLLPRSDSHCWFAVSGSAAANMFSKICAVDLSSSLFQTGAIAQTSVARVNAIIINAGAVATDCFFLLSDISSAEYLWMCLLDAMEEFAGIAVGNAAIRTLCEAPAPSGRQEDH